MNTNGHYTVRRAGRTDEIYIAAIICTHCEYETHPRDFRQPSDRSGQPRYNKARAAMVAHLHDKHRDKLLGTCSCGARAVKLGTRLTDEKPICERWPICAAGTGEPRAAPPETSEGA